MGQDNNFDLEQFEKDSNSKTNNQQTSVQNIGEEMINCPKCGQPMRKSARCCMHCGELNYNNTKNDSIKNIFIEGEKKRLKEEKKLARKKINTSINLDENGKSKKEKKYSTFRRILDLIILIIFIIIVINYKSILNEFNNFRANHYLKQVDKIVTQIDKEIKSKNCIKSNKTIYSFYQSNDYFKTTFSLYTFNQYKGYVEIEDKGNGEYNYYVTISDGKYGLENILYSKDLNKDVIKLMDKEIEIPNSTYNCS